MNNKRTIIIGIASGSATILISLFFISNLKVFLFIFGIGVLIIFLPFVLLSIIQSKTEREKDEMFLEFSRALVQSVESGTPISKSVINLRGKNFGSLSPHIEKLANQIELGISVRDALEIFAKDTKSKTIMRAVTLIREAEKTGGNISVILDSVARSTNQIEKIKSERRASISALVVEGYIIFIVFIVIMIILDIQIIPLTSNLGSFSTQSASLPGQESIPISSGAVSTDSFSFAFLTLLLAQGLFAGLIIGKLSEGKVGAGVKHSFIMVSLAFLLSTAANIFLK